MKKILFAGFLFLVFGQAARAAHVAVEPTMYEAPTELAQQTPTELVQALQLVRELKSDLAFLTVAPRLVAVPAAQAGGGHSAALTWVLSTDDTTTACTTTANCLQNVYRASGACSVSSSFSLLTTTALSSTVTAFTDSTVTPGVWCYGVTFEINGLESNKDTVAVTLQPAPPSGAAATAK